MNSPRPMPFFDGHNDALLRLFKREGADAPRAFLDGEGKGQLDLPMAVQGGFAGGMFAIFVPSPRNQVTSAGERPTCVRHGAGRAGTAAARPDDRADRRDPAWRRSCSASSARPNGRVRICRTVEDIRHCMDAGALAAVLHIEGAEAIDPKFETLDVLHQAGLRSLGPVWSRPNAFGHGVPFRCPSSPDIGPGLTDLGKELVRACNRLKILIDLSHLNERGFWDVAELSDAPLVATHSNAHALSPHSRNLTDKQLGAIRETGGMVGREFRGELPAGRRPPGQRHAGRADRRSCRAYHQTGRRGRRRLRLGFRRRDGAEGARQRGGCRGDCGRAATAG